MDNNRLRQGQHAVVEWSERLRKLYNNVHVAVPPFAQQRKSV